MKLILDPIKTTKEQPPEGESVLWIHSSRKSCVVGARAGESIRISGSKAVWSMEEFEMWARFPEEL